MTNVYLIGGAGCYAFDKTTRSFNDAKVYCLTAFGNNREGKVHEPRSTFQQEQVNKKWNEFAGHNCVMIGINAIGTERRWVYASDNTDINISSWRSRQPTNNNNNNCAWQNPDPEGPKWGDYPCAKDGGCYTLCELIE